MDSPLLLSWKPFSHSTSGWQSFSEEMSAFGTELLLFSLSPALIPEFSKSLGAQPHASML